MLEIDDVIRMNSNFDVVVTIDLHMSINDDKKSVLISIIRIIHIVELNIEIRYFIFLTKKFIIKFLNGSYV